ncbi:hypothetical protein R1sor_000110 [Riccia sorocarpa]|uniref:Meiosis-specific nuclear structural protein 1 n=1 Tax=Riccia sorocarpa TaxID=122646 RepID=A0ABD3GT01_9MARC
MVLTGLPFREASMVKARANEYETQKLSHWVKEHDLAKMRSEFVDKAEDKAHAKRDAAQQAAEAKNETLDRRVQAQKYAPGARAVLLLWEFPVLYLKRNSEDEPAVLHESGTYYCSLKTTISKIKHLSYIYRFPGQKREDDQRMQNFLEEEQRHRERDRLLLEAMKEKSPEIRLLKRYLEVAKMNKERYTPLLNIFISSHEKHKYFLHSSHALFTCLEKLTLLFASRLESRLSQEKEFFEMKEAERNAVFHDLLMETYNKLTREEQERLDKIANDKARSFSIVVSSHEDHVPLCCIAQAETKRRLHIQMKEKVWAAEKAAREKQRDHDVVEMVHQKELDQEKKEHETKRKNVTTLQKYIKQYLMEKEELDREAAEREQKEEQDILDYQTKVEARNKEQDEKKRLQKAFKDKIYGMLMEGHEEAVRERDELEQALNDLYFQQAEEAYHMKAEALRTHREHMKANMRQASDNYWALKAQRQEQMKQEKAEWATKMMEQLLEMNRVDQMNDYKQRMKKAEYKRQIDAQWEEMQYLLAKEAAEEKAKRKKEKAEYDLQMQLLEQERQKILMDCAEELARFFPKGICKTQDDLRLVGLPAKDPPVIKEPRPHRLPTL